jgi:DNA repair protein RecO (recombination protein O)
MSNFSLPAILLRRIEHGEFDLILTFLTPGDGKVTAIAKSARKSVKRFSGVLEPFSVLDIVCTTGRGKGLPVLQEAAIQQPFPALRGDLEKTAYASYWAQLIYEWVEERNAQPLLFRLYRFVLGELDAGQQPAAALSILFQMRFLSLAGLQPNLGGCISCGRAAGEMAIGAIGFDLARGGLICGGCAQKTPGRIPLSRGTIKPLQWVQNGDLKKAGRIRFTPEALAEGTTLLEAFVPYHLGRDPRSSEFLKQIRKAPPSRGYL